MRTVTRRGIALGMLAGLVVLPASLPAVAQEGSPTHISHQQSVVTQLSPIGELDTSKVFTQLSVAGDGPVQVTLENQSTRGLRDLDGIGRPGTDGDSVIWGIDATPAGVHKRTVANHTADLPVELDVAYTFDGEAVEDPRQLVGRDGELTVTYTVRNTTVAPTEVDVTGGGGDVETETVDVGVPLVGMLSLPLDDRFVNVRTNGGTVAGDGDGNTLVNWELVLFEPLGRFEQEVSWSATVSDAIVPGVNAEIVPVSSASYQVLPDTMSQYADVNVAMQQLSGTGGATRISMVVDGLASGTADLLDGMNQLADGAESLREGLQDKAAPGARDLAEGTGKASDGSKELAAGTGKASAGSKELAIGTGKASAGSKELAAGTGKASAGSKELAIGLGALRDGAGEVADGNEAVDAGAKMLSGGLGQIHDGAGQVAGGTGQLRVGAGALADGLLTAALPGSEQIRDGLTALLAAVGGTEDDADSGTVIGGVNALLAGLSGDLAQGTDALKQLTSGLANAFGPDPDAGGLHAGQKAQRGADGAGLIKDGGAAIEGGAGNLSAGIGALQADIPGLNENDPDTYLICTDPSNPVHGIPEGCWTDEVVEAVTEGALTTMADFNSVKETSVNSDALVPLGPFAGTLKNGASALQAGGSDIKNGAAGLQAGLQAQADSLGDWPAGCEAAIGHVMTTADPDGLAVILAQSCIAAQVDGGLTTQIIPGMQRLQAGLNNPACDPANPRNPDNPCGVRQVLELLAGGSSQLAGGLDDAATGAGRLAAGADQLHAGATALQDGTGEAATGSQELAAGTGKLADGARQLADGSVAAAAGGRALANGLGEIDDGANALSSGLGEIDDGANALSSGLGEIDDGANALSSGLGEIDDGASELADGLGDAADGSARLAEGLGSARDGTVSVESNLRDLDEVDLPRLLSGLDRSGGNSDRLLKQARAADERALAGEGLPYPTAEGAEASAVYQFEIAGVGAEQGASTPVRAGAAILAFGAVGALGMGVRRRLI